MVSTSSGLAAGAPAKGSGPGCCDGRTAVCCCAGAGVDADCAGEDCEMVRVAATDAVKTRSASFMGNSRMFLSGELVVLRGWTRELYLRRAKPAEKIGGEL